MGRRAEWTFSGERPDQVVSALKKAIRRGEVDNALHWLVELHLSGEDWWAWRQLVIGVSEECGPAWPEGPATVMSLYSAWRMTGDMLHAVDAVIRLCRAPKSRIADDGLAAHLMAHRREMARPIPDEALDLHTVAGRYKLGRTEDSEQGQQHWWDEAAKLVNEVPDVEADHYRELVKQWWAENRPYPEARKPSLDQKPPPKDYQLPLGVERDGDLVRVPGSRQGDVWVVDLAKGVCTCPAFDRWPPCKHVIAVKALVRTEGR